MENYKRYFLFLSSVYKTSYMYINISYLVFLFSYLQNVFHGNFKCLSFFKTCLRNVLHSSNVQASKVLNSQILTLSVFGCEAISIEGLLVVVSTVVFVVCVVVIMGSLPNLLSS